MRDGVTFILAQVRYLLMSLRSIVVFFLTMAIIAAIIPTAYMFYVAPLDVSGTCCVGYFVFLMFCSAIMAVVGRPPKVAPQTFAQELAESGITAKGEDVIDFVGGADIREFRKPAGFNMGYRTGTLVLTSKRLLFVQRPLGASKGLSLVFHCPLKDVLSVTSSNRPSKQVDLSVQRQDTQEMVTIGCKNAEAFVKKIVDAKGNVAEERTIEAKTVIIEEAKRDNAAEILKKRLAKGEITKEEFHDKIQRM